MERRFFLRGAALIGCSAAAHPFLSTVTLAGTDGGHPLGDHRLIVIILRGAMDGLDVVQPYGDALFASHRPTLAAHSGATDLDGYFALHARLGALMPLWQAGELAFAHAVSTLTATSAVILTGRICWRQAQAWMCRWATRAMAG